VEDRDDIGCKAHDIARDRLSLLEQGLHPSIFGIEVHFRHEVEFRFADGGSGHAGYLEPPEPGNFRSGNVDVEVMFVEFCGVGGFR